MLFFLNQKGPLTKGIFRQSANVKSCRELKEKLNSGAEVQLDCESIFVIASVLKVGKFLPSSTPQHSSGERQLIYLIVTLLPSAEDHDRNRSLKVFKKKKQKTLHTVMCVLLCLTLCYLINCSPLDSSLSTGFSRQEYWSGLPFSPPVVTETLAFKSHL